MKRSKSKTYLSLGLWETRHIAKVISKQLNNGDIVLLSGDLGAGKSVIVRDILKICGVTSKITSPTFTLVNEYVIPNYHFYHFDMYRIEDEDEVKNLGFEEILDDKSAIKFIEWAEKVPSYLPPHYKKITVVKLGKHFRKFIVENI